jgi:hypothetical protein
MALIPYDKQALVKFEVTKSQIMGAPVTVCARLPWFHLQLHGPDLHTKSSHSLYLNLQTYI